MDGTWVMVTYWTPDGEQTLVGKVGDIEKDILEKGEEEFVRFEYARWLSEFDAEEDEEFDIAEPSEDEEETAEEDEFSSGDDLFDELLDDLDDDEDEEEIIRLEDDFIFGADKVFYLKREHIISFAPLKDDFQTLWELTIGDIGELEEEDEEEEEHDDE